MGIGKRLNLGMTHIQRDEQAAEKGIEQHRQPGDAQNGPEVLIEQLVGGQQAGGKAPVLIEKLLFHFFVISCLVGSTAVGTPHSRWRWLWPR